MIKLLAWSYHIIFHFAFLHNNVVLFIVNHCVCDNVKVKTPIANVCFIDKNKIGCTWVMVLVNTRIAERVLLLGPKNCKLYRVPFLLNAFDAN